MDNGVLIQKGFRKEIVMEMKIRFIDETEGMPLDRWDGEQYVHATGREYWDPYPGCWRAEYEDDETVDLPVNQ